MRWEGEESVQLPEASTAWKSGRLGPGVPDRQEHSGIPQRTGRWRPRPVKDGACLQNDEVSL